MKKDYFISSSIAVSVIMVAGTFAYTALRDDPVQIPRQSQSEEVEEVVLPVSWGDLGAKMIEAGVIDAEKFENLYGNELNEEAEQLLYGNNSGNLKITEQNSGILLNLLWAFGLGNKNEILESGPMTDVRYGGAGNFASTAGWILAKGDAMDHYSSYSFVVLTQEQQDLVERVSKGIYRPCCGNSTYFPDCNHGMAMLGFLELMASQGVSEKDIWKAALAVNSYWFPSTYLTIASYMKSKGIEWKDINLQEILGVDYSSASGYQKIVSQMQPQTQKSGASCGV